MSEENIKVITQKEELYEHCENVEQLFDKFYIPLLNIHYKKTYDLQQKVEYLEKENKELKQPQVFIDCEDMEERYARDLYEDYLKEKIEQLENIRKETIEYIENNSYFESNIVKKMVLGDYSSGLLNILNKGSDKE